MNIGVHETHCCIIHGCKYGDKKCPVYTGVIKQKYLCEECYYDYDYIHFTNEQKFKKINLLFLKKNRLLKLKKL